MFLWLSAMYVPIEQLENVSQKVRIVILFSEQFFNEKPKQSYITKIPANQFG